MRISLWTLPFAALKPITWAGKGDSSDAEELQVTADPYGSISAINTLFDLLNAPAICIDNVVFPTLPFWLDREIIFAFI